MLKLILSLTLALATSSIAIANNDQPMPDKNTGNLPVIIKNDLIKPGLCLLTFEDGTDKKVACTKKAEVQ